MEFEVDWAAKDVARFPILAGLREGNQYQKV